MKIVWLPLIMFKKRMDMKYFLYNISKTLLNVKNHIDLKSFLVVDI